MEATTKFDASSSPISVHSGGHESELNKSNTSRRTSSGDMLQELESTGEVMTRFELDTVRVCEKLANLNLFLMHAETKESDFEAFVSDKNSESCELGIKALEFDFLSGFVVSELRVLEACISDLQTEKAKLREFLSSPKSMGELLVGLEDMLLDSDKSLELSLEEVFEIKARSANFERTLLRIAGEESLQDEDDLPKLSKKMKMQTVEHQRHVLRMLEKSLERELDLDKKVTESSQLEDPLAMRLHLELLYVVEEAEMTLEKLYETDHMSELLTDISKDLLRKIQLLQFCLKGLVHREAELSSKLQETIETLKVKGEKVDLLEKELNDTKTKLQNSEACVEASQEKQGMLDSTIKDMENVIEDLKEKVLKAEVQTESMEDKCIYLSEANTELVEELGFVRGRVKFLEASLQRTEESKKATAKDISLRTKLITDLVMQMALERERLQKQISSLKQENKILVKRLKKTEKAPSVKVSHGDKEPSVDHGLSETDVTAENKEGLSTSFELGKARDKTEMGATDLASEATTPRNIDARELTLKHVVLVILVLLIPLFGVLFHQLQVR